MTRRRVIVDCETTSLEPDYETGRGVIWELAVIGLDDPIAIAERAWRMKPDLAKADPASLAVGRYYERTKAMCQDCRPSRANDLTQKLGDRDKPEWSNPAALAAEIAPMLDNATIIGANPTFDANHLSAFLCHYGQSRQPWHYRLRDIGSMAWAYLNACQTLGVEGRDAALGVPAIDASTDEFARALNIDPAKFERHSALGDCRLVAVMLAQIEKRAVASLPVEWPGGES
jgi:hypothetical protein